MATDDDDDDADDDLEALLTPRLFPDGAPERKEGKRKGENQLITQQTTAVKHKNKRAHRWSSLKPGNSVTLNVNIRVRRSSRRAAVSR